MRVKGVGGVRVKGEEGRVMVKGVEGVRVKGRWM